MSSITLPGLSRAAVHAAYRMAEESCVAQRLIEAEIPPAELAATDALARRLVEGVRAKGQGNAVDSLLHSFALSTDEGIALMCLAEALLRIPDAATRDRLIADKIGGKEWSANLGRSQSLFVNASTFGLMLTGSVVAPSEGEDWAAVAKRAVARLGKPVIRRAIFEGMRILGHHFVFGRTIGEALKRGASGVETHSFDMLGEAARTQGDADFYFNAYKNAIAAVGKARGGAGGKGGEVESVNGVSVKLSALHPRYEWAQVDRIKAEMLPRLRELVADAGAADICLAIDAEEADRLDLSMDLIETIVADDTLFANGWRGFGIVIQAYQKRAVPMVDWTIALARRYQRKIMVRLVKGAYWDSEVKATQVGGFADYPVFTRKASTDVSYLACARRLLAADDAIYSGFATHNAATVAAVKAMADGRIFEFQRLHGMGEELYDVLREGEGDTPTAVRIYAPVGGHKELLAYLVRRLLENGANASFVNRLADADQPVEAIIADPVAATAALDVRRNPRIPLPSELFAPERLNSAGIDLSDPLVRAPLMVRLTALEAKHPIAAPIIGGKTLKGSKVPVTAPFDRSITVGHVVEATPEAVAQAVTLAHDAQPDWDAAGVDVRADALEAAANLYEKHTDELLSLCVREAGKTVPDAILELREAVDFLRYYAVEARRQFGPADPLPGPTGESNTLTLHGRGVIAAISPWNFPLAIFTGQIAAALAAGNSVVAKPAGQTPLIAARAVELLHQAGIPGDVLNLLPGDGKVGAALVAHPGIGGVVFTGSTNTARSINLTLAQRTGPIVPLIAETGGQNAMIVDSSALSEQVTRDVVQSAFQSAGQRCSALRVLYLQDDIADGVLEMISGAMRALTIGDPRKLSTDVGPVIDAAARASLQKHSNELSGAVVCRLDLPVGQGNFVAPAAFSIPAISALSQEHFGPLLHVVRFAAENLDAVIDAINATGFGLTLGVHSRIDTTIERIVARARVGNIYVNRNQIGAVVGSQPFGGEGLSGTGPKAGGPHYLARFATERTLCVDTTAAGGNATLLAS
ncbi:bifunctional proline dehydrogenase/L-glutamate gamma-semialdehyde dehydrogenase PutA [Sphingomonas alpina]|uniref:Bifunctional protein PutA n=1 Tax=Sphingomonas alpina TaxID=653931 RepID=A0A7H0LDW5_9SPHN|nr:bifunctional proline dehydrogenase/L-glutamate gamma-semialdehyde dehydrogenase PutA [Sphingomonas alpina]QNQ07868.1 bifunctional proline dehydrogenase/L-glutamate gamma-semialdehyde dehydrogenase PutA [Sphingomonas alpina]